MDQKQQNGTGLDGVSGSALLRWAEGPISLLYEYECAMVTSNSRPYIGLLAFFVIIVCVPSQNEKICFVCYLIKSHDT